MNKRTKLKSRKSHVKSCFDSIPVCPATYVDLEERFGKPEMTFGGGKSGAFVFKLNSTTVLKYYTDAYKNTNEPTFFMDNQRPFREYLSMCSMSGTSGFPLVSGVLCAKSPNKWIKDSNNKIPNTKFGLAVISSVAPGIPLLRIMEKKDDINPALVYKIALVILRLISYAKIKLGDDFEHFDLHPDNIFVDMSNVQEYHFSSYRFLCPVVSLIDFDLVSASKINKFFSSSNDLTGRLGYLQKNPEEWVLKKGEKNKLRLVAERTIKFLQQMTSGKDSLDITINANNIQNTDLRNWYVIISAMMVYALKKTGNKSQYLKICQSVEECIENNSDVFKQFIFLRKRVRALDDNDEQVQKIPRIIKDINDNIPDFIKLFLKNKIINKQLFEFQEMVFQQRGVYPTYDDTTIRFVFPSIQAWYLNIFGITTFLDGYQSWETHLMGGGFTIDLKTKAFVKNIIEINFFKKFVLHPNASNNVYNFILSIFDPPNIGTYLENLKNSLKRNKINVKTKNISNKDLINTKNDFRFKQLKVELAGDDTNITATIEKPSFSWRTLLSFANYLKLGGVKYTSAGEETRSIEISMSVDKPAPLLERINKWFEKIKKMSATEFESLLKDLLMKVSSLLVLEDIGGAILTLLCSYRPALFQLVYVYEDKDSNGQKVTKNITKSIEIGTIFPSAEGGTITYLTLLESYKKDTLFVFMNNTFRFYRQICKMPIQERQEFFRKANEDIDTIIRDAKKLKKFTKDMF